MKRNWKTSLAGVLAIATIGLKIAQAPDSIAAEDIAGVIAGIGLLASKDHNVSGTGGESPVPK